MKLGVVYVVNLHTFLRRDLYHTGESLRLFSSLQEEYNSDLEIT
jgi:hypothetical protein